MRDKNETTKGEEQPKLREKTTKRSHDRRAKVAGDEKVTVK